MKPCLLLGAVLAAPPVSGEELTVWFLGLPDGQRLALRWLALAGILLGALAVGFLLEWVVVRLGGLVTRRTSAAWDEKLISALHGPGRFFLGLLLFHFLLPLPQLDPESQLSVEVIVRAVLIAVATWFVVRFLNVAAEAARVFLTRGVDSAAKVRSVNTRIDVPRGILRFLIVLIGAALVLLQFEAVRGVGVSLIASASLAGLAITLAAQRTLANLLAGVQLAFSQPIKIGDSVVVEGEFGTVEEMNLTNVVIKTWDLRRLILPVSYFLDKPIQNWTRESTELLGTVFLFADYTVPVQAVREELQRYLTGHPLWDTRAQGVQVTNLTDRSVELRILVSARDGGQLWDLRCLVREHFLVWLLAQGHGHLPLQRVELRQANCIGSARTGSLPSRD